VVTNIDKEHLDFYKNIDAIKEVFVSFIDRIPFYGKAIICLDDEFIQDIIPKIKKRFTSYGLKSQADFQAREVVFEGQTTKFTLYYNNEKVDDFSLNMPGVHNVYNALASIAVGFELDIPVKTIKSALETLKGVQRRLEIRETVNNITFIDDYGHHPTEIKTTLNAISKCCPDKRKVVAFQPHRYTRTDSLFNEFSRSFYQSDMLAVLPIYSAGEAEIDGIDSKHLCEAISSHGHKAAIYIDGFNEAVSYFKKNLKPDDIFLTLGAGDIWKLGEALIKALKE
jgi:UDP-N-acetylmuramate--alanine ligase